MVLAELFQRLDRPIHTGSVPPIEIQGLQEDSRLVKPGDLFIARPGTTLENWQVAQSPGSAGAGIRPLSDGASTRDRRRVRVYAHDTTRDGDHAARRAGTYRPLPFFARLLA